MRRVSALAAVSLLLAQPLHAMPGGAAPVMAQAHFDLGRQAFKQGRYELTLHEMMLTLLERPSDTRAREYMRLAGEKLIEQDIDSVSRDRRLLLEGYADALERGRRQAEVWKGRLLQSQAEALQGRWARSYDDAQRVLSENPEHADARAAQKHAVHGLAKTLSSRSKLGPKDWLVYRGLFFLADRQPQPARKALTEAVTLSDTVAELEDERLRFYLARLSPLPAAPAAVPLRPMPAPKPKGDIPMARKAPAPTPQPGQWAYSEGVKKAEAGLFEAAIELFERALAEAPGHPAAQEALLRARLSLQEDMKRRRLEAAQLYAVGLMLYGQGRRADAVARWKRVIALDPEHGYADRALAHAEQELREAGR